MNSQRESLSAYFQPCTNYHLPSTDYQLPTSSLCKCKMANGMEELTVGNIAGLEAVEIDRRPMQSFNRSTDSLGGQPLLTRGKPSAVQDRSYSQAMENSVQAEREDWR